MRRDIDMKKIISLILVFIMLFSITACGGKVEPDINGGNTNVGGDGNEEEKLPNDITGGWGDTGNEPDPERGAKMLLTEFRSGKLGRITLETPNKR